MLKRDFLTYLIDFWKFTHIEASIAKICNFHLDIWIVEETLQHSRVGDLFAAQFWKFWGQFLLENSNIFVTVIFKKFELNF